MGALRAAIGLLSLFFAHFFGRSCVKLCQGKEARSRTIAWSLRATVCVVAVFWGRGLDILAGIVLLLVTLAFAAGVWRQLHPPKAEELTKVMFPQD